MSDTTTPPGACGLENIGTGISVPIIDTTPTPTDKAVELVADAIAKAIGELSIAMGGIVNTESIKVKNAKLITEVIVDPLISELAASRELCRQFREVAELMRDSQILKGNNPAAKMAMWFDALAKLEALNQSVKTDAEI